MSNMAAETKIIQRKLLSVTSGASLCICLSPGQSLRAIPAVRSRLAAPKSGDTRRGQMSFTPAMAHPRLYIQNKSGGLSL